MESSPFSPDDFRDELFDYTQHLPLPENGEQGSQSGGGEQSAQLGGEEQGDEPVCLQSNETPSSPAGQSQQAAPPVPFQEIVTEQASQDKMKAEQRERNKEYANGSRQSPPGFTRQGPSASGVESTARTSAHILQTINPTTQSVALEDGKPGAGHKNGRPRLARDMRAAVLLAALLLARAAAMQIDS
eukprot:426175-Rhodomonas_salina.2